MAILEHGGVDPPTPLLLRAQPDRLPLAFADDLSPAVNLDPTRDRRVLRLVVVNDERGLAAPPLGVQVFSKIPFRQNSLLLLMYQSSGHFFQL